VFEYTVNPHCNGPRYNRQNLAMYNREFLEMLRQEEGFVVTELFKIKKDPYMRGGTQ
jgi:hypothetical protein